MKKLAGFIFASLGKLLFLNFVIRFIDHTRIEETDCTDHDDNCKQFAVKDKYCMKAEYREFMRERCPESCHFCKRKSINM